MTLKFAKMHGLGNDFIVIDGIHQKVNLRPDMIIKLSDRNTGIGFDQCLIVEPSTESNIDFLYRIFNADGQEVGQCGNGARCLARFLEYYQLTNKKSMTVSTCSTTMSLQINSNQTVTVNMGKPRFHPQSIPTTANTKNGNLLIDVHGQKVSIHAVNVGNPHALVQVADIHHAPVETLGHDLCVHTVFPEQANIGFMQIVDPSHIKLRVYERGCGETLACGSGAVATAAIGQKYFAMDKEISVELPGGMLTIDWPDLEQDIYLTGPAAFVFEGQLFDEFKLED